jgi:hypothetical protein
MAIHLVWCNRHGGRYAAHIGCPKCAKEHASGVADNAITDEQELNALLDANGIHGEMRTFAHQIRQRAGLTHARATVEGWRPQL